MSESPVGTVMESPAVRNNRPPWLPALLLAAALAPGAPAAAPIPQPIPPETPAWGDLQPRVIERRPEGGLAYRITVSPEATAERPHRLVVWLHPSGGLYNEYVEGLAPVMLRRGFALMVMTDKDPRGWTFEDAKMLLGTTLPDAGTVPGVDLRRPVLMGFSAGGQVALELWRTKPGLYGGVVVDAAYPADTVDGKDVVFGPPDDPEIASVPMIVFVGEEDLLLWVWERVEAPWKEAGVPLEVHVVPGLGHHWLFGEDQVAALDAWLSRVPAVETGGQAVAPPQEEPPPAVQP